MGTKLEPGKFDCYANAEPDEPMFVLLGRDALAPSLVNIWAMIRAGNRKEAKLAFNELIVGPQASVYVLNPQPEKAQEAVDCAGSMMNWRRANRP
jgi:hypothetical protein